MNSGADHGIFRLSNDFCPYFTTPFSFPPLPEDEMRRAGFQQEERELFQEAWEAMLWQDLFRVEYVTIRDAVEQALATLFSAAVY